MSQLLGVTLAVTLILAPHPMHTSVAEIRETSHGRAAEIAIRVFRDDLAAAVPGSGGAGADSALARYVRRSFTLADRSGRPVLLHWGGRTSADDVLVLHFRADLVGGLAGAIVTHGLLGERFSDQVNIVRASYAGRTTTLLFLPGDSAKRLP